MALLELIKTWQLSHQCNGLSLSSVGSYSPHLTLLWPAGTPLVSLRHESGFYSVVPHRSHIGDPHSSHFDFSSFELPLNLVHLFNDRKLEILRETYRSYAIAPERCKTFIQLFDCFPNGSSFVRNLILSHLWCMIHDRWLCCGEIWLGRPINSEKPRPDPLPPPEGCSSLNPSVPPT